MIKWLKKSGFILLNKINNDSKIAFGCYIKNSAQINIGKRVKVHSGASLDASSSGLLELGDGTTVNRYAYLNASRGGIKIGAGTEINNFSVINGAGGVEIGTNVLVGPGVQIASYQHVYRDKNRLIKEQDYLYRKIVIGDDVWIGANAVILAGVTIGQGSVVGAGSVVTKSCEPYSVLVGAPARVIKKRGG